MAINIDGNGLITLGGTASTQGRVRLSEDTDNGTNYIELTAPASVASDKTITFPDATGTVVISGTTPSLNGITFPATQVASADANTLDDYEEGTWTPLLVASGATIGNLSTSGRYIKVGRSVTLYGYIQQYVSAGGGANAVTITGVPFASQSGITIAGGQCIVSNFVGNANGSSISFKLTAASSTIEYLKYINDSGTSKVDSVKSTDITNANHSIQFSFSYITLN